MIVEFEYDCDHVPSEKKCCAHIARSSVSDSLVLKSAIQVGSRADLAWSSKASLPVCTKLSNSGVPCVERILVVICFTIQFQV